MADLGIKKSIIKNKDLPYVSFDDNSLFYNIRYRIVSDDKNRASHWSPTTKIVVPPTTDAGLPFTDVSRILIKDLGSSPKLITCVWTYPQPSEYTGTDYQKTLQKIFSDVAIFDVWIAWKVGTTWEDFQYVTTTTANNYSTLHRSDNPNGIRIAIQIPTTKKVYDTRLSLYYHETTGI